MTEKMIPLSCPFCPDFIAVNDNAEGLLLFKQHIIDRHLLTEIVDKLGDMIAKQSGNKEGLEQKIKAMVSRLKDIIPSELGQFSQKEVIDLQIENLRKLLE